MTTEDPEARLAIGGSFAIILVGVSDKTRGGFISTSRDQNRKSLHSQTRRHSRSGPCGLQQNTLPPRQINYSHPAESAHSSPLIFDKNKLDAVFNRILL